MESKQKKYAIIFGLLCLLIIVALIIVPKFIDLNRYRGLIVAQIENAVDGKAYIENLSWSITSGLVVKAKNCAILNAVLFPVDFKIKEISARIAVLPLLRKTIQIKNLNLTEPKITVQLTPERLKSKPAKRKSQNQPSPAGKLPVDILINKAAIKNGRITLEDALSIPGESIIGIFDQVEFTGTNLIPGEEMQFALSFEDPVKPGIGKLKTSGTFKGLTADFRIDQPVLKGKVAINGFSVDAIKPYMRGHALAGKIDGDISLEISYSGDRGKRWSIAGFIDLSELSYSDPALWNDSLENDIPRIEGIDISQLDLSFSKEEGKTILDNINASIQLTGTPMLSDSAAVNTDKYAKGINIAANLNAYKPPFGGDLQFKLTLDETGPLDLGTFKTSGTLRIPTEAMPSDQPMITCKATLDRFNLDAIKPYIKDKSFTEKLGGNLSLQLDYTGDLGSRFTVAGDIDLSRLTYSDPTLWEKNLQNDTAHIQYHIHAAPDHIEVEKLDLHVGNLLLTLNATVDDYQKNPTVKNAVLSGDLPLKEIIPLVPMKLSKTRTDLIRSIIEGGGTISIKSFKFPELNINALPEKWASAFKKSKGTIQIKNASFRPDEALPRLEKISADLTLSRGIIETSVKPIKLGHATLPALKAKITDITGQPKLTAKAKGPIRLPQSSSHQLDTYFKQYGLTGLSGIAVADLEIDYDSAHPESWHANGSLDLENTFIEFESKGLQLTDLNGGIHFSREKDIRISFNNLRGHINQSPFRVNGDITHIGDPHLQINASTKIERLNLVSLTAFSTELMEADLSGVLDIDMDIDLKLSDPYQASLNGFLKAINVNSDLRKPSLSLREGFADFKFAGDSIELKSLTVRANDQQIFIRGTAENPKAPLIRLTVAAENIDVDRLFPAENQDKKAHSSDATTRSSDSETRNMPEYVKNLRVRFDADIKNGIYRKTEFDGLTLTASYEDGIIKSHDLAFNIADGHVKSSGFLDLRDLKHIQFKINPKTEALRLEKIASLFQRERFPVEGPLTVSGFLKGSIDDKNNLINRLNGQLLCELGQGQLFNVGPLGSIITKILSFKSLKGVLSGNVVRNMTQKGMAIEKVSLDTTILGGRIQIKSLSLKANSLNAASVGEINLVNEKLDLGIEIEPLGTLNEAMGFVPIIGKVGQKLTKIYLDVKGPFADPTIRVSPIKGLSEFVREGLKTAGDIVEEGLDRAEKLKSP